MSSLTPPPDHAPTVEQTRWFMEEVRPHEPKVRAWLQARFPAISDMDDLIQETYLRILRARNAGDLRHPKAYLYAAARNAALDRCRRSRIISFERLADVTDSSVLIDANAAPATDLQDRELELEVLAEAIRELPERCREVLVLRKRHGLSHREIADRLGISPHTVNAQITIAMIKCRAFFQARGLLPQPPHGHSNLQP